MSGRDNAVQRVASTPRCATLCASLFLHSPEADVARLKQGIGMSDYDLAEAVNPSRGIGRRRRSLIGSRLILYKRCAVKGWTDAPRSPLMSQQRIAANACSGSGLHSPTYDDELQDSTLAPGFGNQIRDAPDRAVLCANGDQSNFFRNDKHDSAGC